MWGVTCGSQGWREREMERWGLRWSLEALAATFVPLPGKHGHCFYLQLGVRGLSPPRPAFAGGIAG